MFWNSRTALQAKINAFDCAVVVNCPLYAMLSQYGIGFGTCPNGFVDNDAATRVSDASIHTDHTELNRLFATGSHLAGGTAPRLFGG